MNNSFINIKKKSVPLIQLFWTIMIIHFNEVVPRYKSFKKNLLHHNPNGSYKFIYEFKSINRIKFIRKFISISLFECIYEKFIFTDYNLISSVEVNIKLYY